MISYSNSLSRGSGMPIQVRGVLVHAMSGTELSRVRTEFRLRLPEPINKSSLESRGPTLLCNQVKSHSLGLLSYPAFDSGGAQMTHGLAAGTAVQVRDAGVSGFSDHGWRPYLRFVTTQFCVCSQATPAKRSRRGFSKLRVIPIGTPVFFLTGRSQSC